MTSQGDFDRAALIFSNSVLCDAKAKGCRKERYFDAVGKPFGEIDKTTTRLLFIR